MLFQMPVPSVTATEFFLSEDDEPFAAGDGFVWASFEREGAFFVGLQLAAGQTIFCPTLQFDRDMTMVCDVSFGPLSIFFKDADGRIRPIAQVEKGGRFSFDLGALHGNHGTIGLSAGAQVIVVEWVIGRSDRLGLLSARSHHARRVHNEGRFFTTVYDHAIYGDRAASKARAHFRRPRIGATQHIRPLTGEDLLSLDSAQVQVPDDAYHLAHRVLGEALKLELPICAERLAAFHTDRPVRLLSLCSGAAGVEFDIIGAAAVPTELTIMDINTELMERAAATLAPIASVFGVVGDVNTISAAQFGGRFDVAMCVSGLHHVVELEHVLRTISTLLADNGEFWMVGEQIGRNGNRLWPEAYAIADHLFSQLPAQFRLNAQSGNIDDHLPSTDFSSVAFEGIRSSEIEALAQSFFEPVQMCTVVTASFGAFSNQRIITTTILQRKSTETLFSNSLRPK